MVKIRVAVRRVSRSQIDACMRTDGACLCWARGEIALPPWQHLHCSVEDLNSCGDLGEGLGRAGAGGDTETHIALPSGRGVGAALHGLPPGAVHLQGCIPGSGRARALRKVW